MRANKQEEILKAAIHCIGKFGIEKTNAQTIADHLGVAQSGIFYYFPKQKMLFDSLIHYIVQVNHEIVQRHIAKSKPTTSYDQLLAHIEGNLRWAKTHPDQVGVLLLSMVRAQSNPEMKTLINKILKAGESRVLECLQTGLTGTEFSIPIGVETAAAVIHKTLTGAIVSYYHSRSRHVTVGEFNRLVRTSVDSLLLRDMH